MPKAVICPCCGESIDGDYFSADKARRYFFAALRDAHANLPDNFRQRWPNIEAMRKELLIHVGWCEVRTIVCETAIDAQTMARELRREVPYSIAISRDNVVQFRKAKSMNRTSMPKKQFLEVAEAVFAYIAQATGIDPSQSIEGRNAA